MQAKAVRLLGTGASLPLTWSNLFNDGTAARLTVPAAGIYPVNVWMCEDGGVIDRVIIQPTGFAAPTGAGPAASPIIFPVWVMVETVQGALNYLRAGRRGISM